ncbi:MAG: hypothetical protein AB1491_06060 [Thermodesulfobacteriota bacterium]
MPYILPKHRKNLDGLIDQLADAIISEGAEYADTGAFAGLLNYTCTCLALKVVRRRCGPMRYWLIAILTGVFKNIADEFYRRVAAPYENRQMLKNGDVALYQEYLKEVEEA